jgi:Cdc6-like AAA superfamily ATPase
MSGFRKAKAEQAALKIGIYGPPGSGKTFTSLLLAEGLAEVTKKRIAYVDTEHGTDFYCQAVSTRKLHPEAIDFDAIYTRALTEVISACKGLDPKEYGVIIIDSITHLWEAARAAYTGRETKAGTIPFQAWGKIKKPYKDLMSSLLSSPMHVIICGRQGIEYETDEETEELRAIGVKMKAEGETPYEPHILLRMEAIKPKKTNEVAQIIAYAEKDRTGVLSGRSFVNPTFETLCVPLLGLLGEKQAHMDSGEEAASKDAEALARQEKEREAQSNEHLRKLSARIDLCASADELKLVAKEITPKLKAQMLPQDVATLREKYQERDIALARGVPIAVAGPEKSYAEAFGDKTSEPAE